MPPTPYIQCLVCGRLTPIDRGVCYHCHSPLPSKVTIPPGMIVCPNCLKVTPIDTGYCRHCRAPLPTLNAEISLQTNSINSLEPSPVSQPQIIHPRDAARIAIGPIGRGIKIGALDYGLLAPRRLRIVRGND